MKNNQESNKSTGVRLQKSQSSPSDHHHGEQRHALSHIDTDEVIMHVGEKKKAFEMSCRFFCFQVASSSIANVVGTVCGHPLDTIRVRMQLEQGMPSSFLRTCSETFRGEGVRGFFKGLVSPVVGVTPYNTMVFTITEAMRNELGNRYEDMSEEKKSFISGSFAGGMALIIYNPVELLKVRAQVNRVENLQYRKAIPELIRTEGWLALYKGFMPLIFRDVPAWGVYFWTYEFLKRRFGVNEAKKNGTDNSPLNLSIKIWAAGVSGQASWAVSYPWDIIKTQIQCTETRRVPMREVINDIYAREGSLGFWKGFAPTLARSFVVNAIALPTFEYINDTYCYAENKKTD